MRFKCPSLSKQSSIYFFILFSLFTSFECNKSHGTCTHTQVRVGDGEAVSRGEEKKKSNIKSGFRKPPNNLQNKRSRGKRSGDKRNSSNKLMWGTQGRVRASDATDPEPDFASSSTHREKEENDVHGQVRTGRNTSRWIRRKWIVLLLPILFNRLSSTRCTFRFIKAVHDSPCHDFPDFFFLSSFYLSAPIRLFPFLHPENTWNICSRFPFVVYLFSFFVFLHIRVLSTPCSHGFDRN